MKKINFILSFLALSLATFSYAGDLKFKSLGFEIDSLNAKPNSTFTILHQYFPARNGFAANVNVMLQEFSEPLTSYDKITREQFKKLDFEIINQKRTKNYLTYEYAGILGGVKMHFYSKAYKKANFVYLITATDIEENWHRRAKQLKANVDSFKFSN